MQESSRKFCTGIASHLLAMATISAGTLLHASTAPVKPNSTPVDSRNTHSSLSGCQTMTIMHWIWSSWHGICLHAIHMSWVLMCKQRLRLGCVPISARNLAATLTPAAVQVVCVVPSALYVAVCSPALPLSINRDLSPFCNRNVEAISTPPCHISYQGSLRFAMARVVLLRNAFSKKNLDKS